MLDVAAGLAPSGPTELREALEPPGKRRGVSVGHTFRHAADADIPFHMTTRERRSWPATCTQTHGLGGRGV